MKTFIIFITAFISVISLASDPFATSETEVDYIRSTCPARKGSGEDLLLAACAFGYADAGCPKKANECIAEIRSQYTNSPVLKMLEPEFLKMPCSVCLGFKKTCERCGGCGSVEAMKGSAPVKCLVCRGTGKVNTPCETCKSSGVDPMSKLACSILYSKIPEKMNGPLKMMFDSRNLIAQYVDFLILGVSAARARMDAAVIIKGEMFQAFRNGGGLVNLSGITYSDGTHADVHNNILVSTRDEIAEGSAITRFAYKDGVWEYTTVKGEDVTVDRYLLSPWQGLLQQETDKPKKPPEKTVSVMGIPKSVFDRIRREAERKWPDEYGMQKWQIENEVRDYKALQNIR